jgi:hypothetical protein
MSGANIILNGDFSLGSTDWTLVGDADVVPSVGISGSNCAYLGSVNYSQIYQENINVYQNCKYNIVFYAKGTMGQVLKISIIGMNNQTVSVTNYQTINGLDFTRYSFSFVTEDSLLKIRFVPLTSSSPIYIDNISCVPMAVCYPSNTPVQVKDIVNVVIINTTIDNVVGGIHAIHSPSVGNYVDVIYNVITDPYTTSIPPSKMDSTPLTSLVSRNVEMYISPNVSPPIDTYVYTIVMLNDQDIIIDGATSVSYSLAIWNQYTSDNDVRYLVN